MTVITVGHLTKIYHLYDSPTARLKEALHPFRKKYHHDFYALKEVSFAVQKGEVLGILGQNGCGKSTLLKILAGVLTPTSGAVSVQGNISALLELGSGFNPEFTGLENVYFSSTIMGYTREQVEKNLEAILAFADIGEFIHQPVKTYSSGMFVRLAFAVAINVEPDILIVDEALAVGDEAFQRKCFAKIQVIQERGATILFVSHVAQTIIELYHRALLFDHGELILSGVPKMVVAKYQQLLSTPTGQRQAFRETLKQTPPGPLATDIAADAHRSSNPASVVAHEWYDPNLRVQPTAVYAESYDYGVRISDLQITTLAGLPVNHLLSGRTYIYTYQVEFQQPAYRVRFAMAIKTATGFLLGGALTAIPGNEIPMIEPLVTMTIRFRFRCLLHPGTYFMNAGVRGRQNEEDIFLDRAVDGLIFKVQPESEILETGLVSFFVEPSVSKAMMAANG